MPVNNRNSGVIMLKSYLEAISEIGRICRQTETGGYVSDQVLDIMINLFHFSGATMYLVDEDNKKMQPVQSLQQKIPVLGFLSYDPVSGLGGWIVNNRKPAILTDSDMIRNFDKSCSLETFVSLPLQADDRIIGLLNLGANIKVDIDDVALKVLEIIAEMIAWGLNSREADDKCAESDAIDGYRSKAHINRVGKELKFT